MFQISLSPLHGVIREPILPSFEITKITETRMWANAQRDGRPAKYRWRPLFNTAVWLTATTRVPCSNTDKKSKPLKLAGVPQTNERFSADSRPKFTKGSQPIVGRSSPYCKDMWRRYCCLTSFFPIVDMCLSWEDVARRSCAMVPRWQFLATFLRPVFAASPVQQVSDLHSKFALRPRHV